MKELLEILVYIMAHPKAHKPFTGKITISKLVMYVREKVAAKNLLVSKDETGAITGLVIWTEKGDKSLHINQILVNDSSVIKAFLEVAGKFYAGWTINSDRPFSLRKYSQSQLKDYFYAR